MTGESKHVVRARHVCGSVFMIAILSMGSCAAQERYFKVTEPGSGKVYYTTSQGAARNRDGGAVRFFDAKTGSQVTLQSSDISQLSKEEFDAAVPSRAPQQRLKDGN